MASFLAADGVGTAGYQSARSLAGLRSGFGYREYFPAWRRAWAASGYVVDSVPLVLSAAAQVDEIGFEEMLRELIMAGEDRDTTCAIAGQLAGAAIGYARHPRRLIDQLPDSEIVHQVSSVFAELAPTIHAERSD